MDTNTLKQKWLKSYGSPLGQRANPCNYRRVSIKTLLSLISEIERLKEANSTRPDYDLTCQQCGRAHILDTSIPSEVWNKIAQPEDLLCTVCIDSRLKNAGLATEAEFYYAGPALNSKLYEESHGEIAKLRADLDEAVEFLGCALDEWEGEHGTYKDPNHPHWSVQARAFLSRMAGGRGDG